MIIMLVVGVLVIGGGAAGYYFFMKPKDAEASIEEGADVAKKEVKKSSKVLAEVIELEPLILPIIDANGASQTVSMVIALELDNPGVVSNLEQLKPRLKSAYIQDLYGILNSPATYKGGVVQVDALRQRINLISRNIIGEKDVHDVMLKVVQQRQI